ncbi:Fe-S cluster assembly protein HesB [Labedella populi]|uniref:Fe-S cluster assembly protein HesB n=1 Tax=Labedella populi TaxID=2498850 RepID=A0A3S3ZHA8_9MICO|nr:HhH-GPD-type base excision DNA repair protein [Labedella populi]RWZ59534.1 Fe-S cluster assembly protein HesB [Labedella populi]
MNTLRITDDAEADRLLSEDPLALLIGMLLDQQIAMETAFSGPAKIRDRFGTLEARSIADADPEGFVELFRRTPAVHRFPGSMAGRVQSLCRAVADEWDGDAASIWTRGRPDGREILDRLVSLPGFGEQKARVFLALLGKQCGLGADGWREAAGAYGEEGAFRSVADITDPESLARVRETKRAMKAAARSSS